MDMTKVQIRKAEEKDYPFILRVNEENVEVLLCVLGWWGNAKRQHSEKCRPLACPHLGTICLELV